MRGGRGAQVLQDAAGLGRHGGVDGIDLADAVEPRRRQHDPAERHAGADKPGVAALRHDGDAGPGAFAHREGDLPGIGRPHDRERRALVEAAALGEVAGHVGGIGEDVLRPDAGADCVQKPCCIDAHSEVPCRRRMAS